MKGKTGRFLYDGIQVVLNGKAAFMEQIMRIEPVLEDILKKLVDNEALMEKLCRIKTKAKKGTFMHFELTEADLELMYDTLYAKNFAKVMESGDGVQKLYVTPLRSNKITYEIDATCYVLYAIVMNEACREKLYECTPNRGEFYQYWENSVYNYFENEQYLPVEYIWDFRLLVGMIEKMREEEYRGETYQLLMRIIYAGNHNWKRQLKGESFISGTQMKEYMAEQLKRNDNILMVRCHTMMLLAMADDMGISIRWDYEWMVQMQFFDEFQKKKTQTNDSFSDSSLETLKEKENSHKVDFVDFLKKFEEKHASHCSLMDIAMNPTEDDIGHLLINLMHLYQMHPRKFAFHALAEEECEEIFDQCENWNQKKYRYMVMIANLCKYIQDMEEKYLYVCREIEELETLKIIREENTSEKIQNERMKLQYEKDISRINAEKKQLTDIISGQEVQISKLKRLLEQTETKLQEDTQELGALRSYVYLMSEQEETFEQEPQENELNRWIDFLKEKKVLVIGGHVNWQNKLKELFPKWQFVTAKQGTLVGNVIKGRDVIVCNTMVLDHGCYYKVVAELDRRQQLCYVHSNNIEKCLGEIVAQME